MSLRSLTMPAMVVVVSSVVRSFSSSSLGGRAVDQGIWRAERSWSILTLSMRSKRRPPSASFDNFWLTANRILSASFFSWGSVARNGSTARVRVSSSGSAAWVRRVVSERAIRVRMRMCDFVIMFAILAEAGCFV